MKRTMNKKQPQVFSTLDDVPEFVTRSVAQLYSNCFERFEYYDGVVIYGPRSDAWPETASPLPYWGREMVLASHERLQLRYWPVTLLSDENYDPPCIRIATKISSPNGDSQVSVFTGFQKSAFGNDGTDAKDGRCDVHDGNGLDLVESTTRIVGCRGLHIFMASLFKRHNVPQTLEISAMPRSNYDRFGYESLRSTTYSIHKTDKKNLDKSIDHASACAASPGTSMLMIAGEIVDVHLEPLGGRVCQPISHRKWRENAQFIKAEILQNPRGEAAGTQAIAAASCIVDLLSAEGLVGMLAGPFYKGALPDRIVGPHGLPMVAAMAVNLAMHWHAYGLPRPSLADRAASEQLRLILQSSTFGPLPSVHGTHWCIDVVTRGALRACEPDFEAIKKDRGLPASSRLVLEPDQKVFYQRMGQRLITYFFGLGSVLPRRDGGTGTAWRVADPLQRARDKFNAQAGCLLEGVDEKILPQPASFGERKAAFVTMLNDVETYLRCGEFNGVEIAPTGSLAEQDLHLAAVKPVLSDLMAPKMVQDLVAKIGRMGAMTDVTDETSYEQQYAAEMSGHFHIAAMGPAISDCREALLHGPAQHFKYLCGAYLAARTQTSPCTDCMTPVHVLQGSMISNAYGACSACHAKRCVPCADAYAKAVQVRTSQVVGKRCRICGADPALVTVNQHYDEQGREYMTILLGERTPEKTDTALDSDEVGAIGAVGAVGASQSSSSSVARPKESKPTKRKGKGSGGTASKNKV